MILYGNKIFITYFLLFFMIRTDPIESDLQIDIDLKSQ